MTVDIIIYNRVRFDDLDLDFENVCKARPTWFYLLVQVVQCPEETPAVESTEIVGSSSVLTTGATETGRQ